MTVVFLWMQKDVLTHDSIDNRIDTSIQICSSVAANCHTIEWWSPRRSQDLLASVGSLAADVRALKQQESSNQEETWQKTRAFLETLERKMTSSVDQLAADVANKTSALVSEMNDNKIPAASTRLTDTAPKLCFGYRQTIQIRS